MAMRKTKSRARRATTRRATTRKASTRRASTRKSSVRKASTRKAATRRGANGGNLWTRADIAFMRKNYRTHSTAWCARQLGRTVYSVRYKASDLSIKKAKPSVWKDNTPSRKKTARTSSVRRSTSRRVSTRRSSAKRSTRRARR